MDTGSLNGNSLIGIGIPSISLRSGSSAQGINDNIKHSNNETKSNAAPISDLPDLPDEPDVHHVPDVQEAGTHAISKIVVPMSKIDINGGSTEVANESKMRETDSVVIQNGSPVEFESTSVFVTPLLQTQKGQTGQGNQSTNLSSTLENLKQYLIKNGVKCTSIGYNN